MNIQYASDLHVEFPENQRFIRKNPLSPAAEILILAGDIVPFSKLEKHRAFFKYCSAHYKQTFWIAGNHEFYLGDLDGRIGSFKEEIEPNVFLG